MSAAQETTIYIAISIVLAFFIYNLIILLLCLAFRVRVDEFQMFFTIKKIFITNFKIKNTNFKVGIIPINAHINIHGMVDDTTNVEAIDDTMLISKPKSIQRTVMLLPLVIFSICFVILLFFMNSSQGILQNFNTAFESFIHVFKTLIGSFNSEEALNKWVELKGNNNPFILILSTVFLSTIISSALALFIHAIRLSVPDKLTTIVLALTSLMLLVYLAFAYRVIQTAMNLYGGIDVLILVVIFIITSCLSAALLFQTLRVLPKEKFV